ncbi:HD-GYP domain-containing protein [Endothiovibrio diazotrophicus]
MIREILNARILVVDDETINIRMLERMLHMEGYRDFTGEYDPRRVAERHRKRAFDLILLDLRMPHLDGFEVMRRLREVERGDYLPVLVLTAQTDDETRVRALSSGAKDFVTKPFNRVEVLNRIRNLLEVRLLHEQVRDQNLILERKVRERTRELWRTRREIIHRLGRAAEYRDNETGLHVIRVGKLCELLGRAVGMEARAVERLLHASPMHDIGKIGIPDAILLKPGRLDATEWEVMKRHTVIGAELLQGHGHDLLEMSREVALTHHERWDGEGYPCGLAGAAIPLVGRITAVCDVFDALTSPRPYKAAWEETRAFDYLAAHAGSQFDPSLVAAFLERRQEVSAIRARYAEPETPESVTEEMRC